MVSPSAPDLGILGLGHVGLPTALAFAELGWMVVGADDDQGRAEQIARGIPPFHEPGVRELLQRHLESGRFRVAESVPAVVRAVSLLFVCVGTPTREDGSADLSQLENVGRTVGANLNGPKIIVEKSTAPVRTAEQLKKTVLRYAKADGGQRPEVNHVAIQVAVNPEFLRQGTAMQDFLNPDRIVLGVESDSARDTLLRIYRPMLDRLGPGAESRVIVTDVNTAEIVKHAANAFLATKVSFINMIGELCEATGADVETVARGIGADPRIGAAYLNAGIGFGGHCLPKDLWAFRRIAEDNGVDFGLLREVERINQSRIDQFLAKVRRAVGQLDGKELAIWGLAFKPGTDDCRGAPSLRVTEQLLLEGAKVCVYDPQAMPEFRRYYAEDPERMVYALSAVDAVRGTDALLILTEWKEFSGVDMLAVKERMAVPTVVDGRNILDPALMRSLGFDYHSVGRP